MPRVRTASGRHTITIYEDETNDTRHDAVLPARISDHYDAEQSPHETALEENQLYVPVAEYRFDENAMLHKLGALESLSQSIHNALPMHRKVSTSTVSAKDEQDPFLGLTDDEDTESVQYTPSDIQSAIHRDHRKASDTYSEMPPELDMPGTYSSPTPLEEYLSPISQKKARHRLNRDSQLLSSPYYNTSNRAISPHILSSPGTPISARQRSSAFRNPSSVRAIQMSSPSPPPFAQSPRSARHRSSTTSRGGTTQYLRPDSRTSHLRDATSTRSPLSKHADPRKEYPLILLHCSVAPIELPYSQATLQAILPPFALEDLMLLREKIATNILERGLLISHPGEDYELLEERVLESLELRRPRLGKCGHFHDTNADSITASPQHQDGNANGELALSSTNPTCTTCAHPLSATPATDASACVDPSDVPRRWDLRVYAANGLLRAGAWSAAWREMEKVDLEIGVWVPEDMRRVLDREEEEREERERSHGAHLDLGESRMEQGPSTPWTADAPPTGSEGMRRGQGSRNVSTSSTASTAPCSRSVRRPSTHRTRSNIEPHRLPLSTLLTRYAHRRLGSFHRPELGILLAALVLGLAYILAIKPAMSLLHPGAALAQGAASAHGAALAQAPALTDMLDLPSPLGLGLEIGEQVVDAAKGFWGSGGGEALPACTFLPSAAAGAGMTALPVDVAWSVLSYLASSSFSVSTSTLTSTTTSTSTSTTTSATTAVSTSEATSTSTSTVTTGEPPNAKETGAGVVGEMLGAVGQMLVPDGIKGVVGD